MSLNNAQSQSQFRKRRATDITRILDEVSTIKSCLSSLQLSFWQIAKLLDVKGIYEKTSNAQRSVQESFSQERRSSQAQHSQSSKVSRRDSSMKKK